MSNSDDLSIGITGIEPWDPPEGEPGRGMTMHTTRGDVRSIVHHDQAIRTTKGIIWVWGARGGFAGPAEGLYRDLAEELRHEITSVRIDYRQPNVIPECVMDTLVGVSFLTGTGHTDIALVGHSFGGAVVISAAPFSGEVKAVVALSSQTHSAQRAAQVAPRPLLSGARHQRHAAASVLLRDDPLLGRRAEGTCAIRRSRARPRRVQRRAEDDAARLAEG